VLNFKVTKSSGLKFLSMPRVEEVLNGNATIPIHERYMSEIHMGDVLNDNKTSH
jgi:hypothetical protein